MLLQSIVTYLLTVDAVTSLLNTPESIYMVRLPTEATMPWIVVDQPTPGQRDRLTSFHIQPNEVIHVICDADDQFTALEIAQAVLTALDNYRGDMSTSQDVYLRCGGIHFTDGYGGTVGAVIRVRALSLESLTRPEPMV